MSAWSTSRSARPVSRSSGSGRWATPLVDRSRRRPAARAGAGRYVAPGVLCLLRQRDAVLLIEGARRKRWAGKLQGIGGGVQPGENPVRAALRGIREETGLQLSAGDVQVKGGGHSQRLSRGRDR